MSTHISQRGRTHSKPPNQEVDVRAPLPARDRRCPRVPCPQRHRQRPRSGPGAVQEHLGQFLFMSSLSVFKDTASRPCSPDRRSGRAFFAGVTLTAWLPWVSLKPRPHNRGVPWSRLLVRPLPAPQGRPRILPASWSAETGPFPASPLRSSVGIVPGGRCLRVGPCIRILFCKQSLLPVFGTQSHAH